MSTHLPVRLYTPLRRQHLGHVSTMRFFSATPMALGRGRPGGSQTQHTNPVAASRAARYQQGTSSSAMQEQELVDERKVPDDVGLIPGSPPFNDHTRVEVLIQTRYLRSRTLDALNTIFDKTALALRVVVGQESGNGLVPVCCSLY